MEKIDFLFEKWALLADAMRNKPGFFTLEQLSVWRTIIAQYIDSSNQDVVYSNLNDIYRYELKCSLKKDDVAEAYNADKKEIMGVVEKRFYFVTVNYDDKIITVPDIKKSIEKIRSISGIRVGDLVVEKFRRNNEGNIYVHHHVHMILYTDFPKSKVIQYIFQKVNKFVSSKNFIDVDNKQSIDAYEKYIRGDKQECKLECVRRDIIWRNENGLNNL